MPTFVVHTPVGVNQIRIKKAIQEAVAEATRLRQIAAQFGGFAHRQEQRQQSGRRDSGGALRAVGRGRDRGQTDAQGRRLREQEHSILGALQSGPPGPRRPQSGRRAQVPAARRVAGAGAGLRAGSARRLHRQRSRPRLRAGQGPALPHARRREPESRCWRNWKRRSWKRPTGSASAPWASAARPA